MRRFALILSITLGLCFLSSCHKVEYGGQKGKILHNKYDPALNINYIMDDVEQTWDTLKIDLDRDGETDLRACFFYDMANIIASKDWEISVAYDGYISEAYGWSREHRVYWGHLSPLCVRHIVDEGYCFGWLDCYSTKGSEGQVDAIRFYLREIAYCTCPNYPLKWGEK